MSDPRTIVVRGAREHNLRNVSLTLPHGKLICFTGVSGSGKSSFAFDTLYAEGQRRYLESLSSYARQFLGQLAKPDVDQITGLSPSVSIQQKTSGWNPRSTVGTVTQIHDYLRVLFARIGKQHCPQCGKPISAQTREQIVARIMELGEGTKVHILAPVIRGQKGEHRDLFEDMLRKGYARARVDGAVHSLSEPPQLTKTLRHDIEIVVDRIVLSDAGHARLAEAVEQALKLGVGSLIVQQVNSDQSAGSEAQANSKKTRATAADDLLLSSQFACPNCRLSFSSPSPQLFSFNSPQGMCLNCEGLGTSYDFDPDSLVPNPKKSFLNLAIEPMRTRIGRWRRHIYRGIAKHVGFDLEAPWEKLSKKARMALLFGLGDKHVTYEWKWSGGVWRHGGKFEGVVAELREKHRKAQSPMVRAYYEKYMRKAVCQSCKGARLNSQALSIRIADRNLNDVCAMAVREARDWAGGLTLTKTEQAIAHDVLREIRGRLGFLCDVGLDYLSLDRTAPTLSGGESQRIRLASQIGAGLVGVLYVLDEPSIGLHPRDNDRLLQSLLRLRNMGNTVIVVEHDEQTMLAADEIVDFGPGPGVRGGEIVAQGDLDTIRRSERSITGRFLRGEERIEIPQKRRSVKTSSPLENQ
ncbi:MAG: excinuclease ABC subunit UvrA [Planctomycetes bacterium]|nr:excinuclease ABC subunit UvrA [Planctomycetota bacterium]MBI3832842.1 excinuclease ABC subunit UvrA [Planctomycetota bacterium]